MCTPPAFFLKYKEWLNCPIFNIMEHHLISISVTVLERILFSIDLTWKFVKFISLAFFHLNNL